MLLTRDTVWTPVRSMPIRFKTYHPQGMVKIGDSFFVSSVEVTESTKRLPAPVDGKDRDAGAGVGHVFKIDAAGTLLADLRLGEGTVYHPGGLDYDGQSIWVPVAEYRPNSRSIVYRVDPRTMTATEVLRVADHIGALVHNTDDHTLHGVSWGSRRFYRWTLGPNGVIDNNPAQPTLNPSHYIDYQDCKVRGTGAHAVFGGRGASSRGVNVSTGRPRPHRLADGRPLHLVPVPLWTDGGLDMTHNPTWFEPTEGGLRAYFMPDDNASTLYIYDATTQPGRSPS